MAEKNVSLAALADLEFDSQDTGDRVTIKQYLKSLLQQLLDDGEEFNGKRPFGFSNWLDQVYIAMVQAKVVDGQLDDDGYIEEFDQHTADTLLSQLVESL